jgi:hypothetical protein
MGSSILKLIYFYTTFYNHLHLNLNSRKNLRTVELELQSRPKLRKTANATLLKNCLIFSFLFISLSNSAHMCVLYFYQQFLSLTNSYSNYRQHHKCQFKQTIIFTG